MCALGLAAERVHVGQGHQVLDEGRVRGEERAETQTDLSQKIFDVP